MMGFATDLQGKTSHEALMSLQDAELRLLDNMKRCMSLRVKCDREYAIALNSVCIQTLKIDQNELKGSMVARVSPFIIFFPNILNGFCFILHKISFVTSIAFECLL